MERSFIAAIAFLLTLSVTQHGNADDAGGAVILGPDEATHYVEPLQATEPATPPSAGATAVTQGFPQAGGAAALPLATVKYREETAQFHRVDVRGSALASISRDKILSSDSDEVLQEVRTALQDIEGLIGDFAQYDFFIDQVFLDNEASESASPYTIDIKQRIDNFEAGFGELQVGADDKVTLVALTFINPAQEATRAAYRLPDAEIRGLAKAALRAELGEDVIDEAVFGEHSRAFVAVDEHWHVQPNINYVYKGSLVAVNAISGEAEVRSGMRRATNEFSSAVCRQTSGKIAVT